MIGPIVENLKALDPGGVRLARGVHFLLVTAIAGGVCYVVAIWLKAPEAELFAILGAAVALNAFIFTPTGSRRSEAIAFLQNTGIALIVFGVGAVIGWQEIGFGHVPVDSVWVVVIAFGLYVRRYGAAATQYGLMVTLMFMFVTLANPTRELSLWLMLAAAVAGATGLLVHNVLWRPSAVAALKREVVRFQRAIASEVMACRMPDSDLPPHWAKRAWDMLSRASQLALAERPDERPRLQHINAIGLRELMALKVVTSAVHLSHGDPPSSTDRRDFNRIYADTIGLLNTPSAANGVSYKAFFDDMRTVRDDLVNDANLVRGEKFHWIRQILGLSRVVDAAKSMRSATDAIGEPWTEAVQKPAAVSSGKDGAAMGWRLAVQGAIAAGATVAIGLIFDLDHAYWATMTVFIVLSASLGATIKRTIERAVGTSVGVIAAIGLHHVIGDDLSLQLVFIGLATLPLFVLIERHYMIAAGLIGFMVVLLLHVVEGVGIAGMEARLYQTALGASLALLASWCLFPIRAKDHVRPRALKLLADSDAAVASVRSGDAVAKVSLAQLNGDSQALTNELIGLNSERFILRHHSLDSSQLQAHADAVVGYTGLYLSTIRSLQNATIPDRIRDLEDKLAVQVRAQLSADADSDGHGDQSVQALDDMVTTWQTAVPLDGSVPASEAMLVIEELYYGRKLVDTAAGLRRALAGLRV